MGANQQTPKPQALAPKSPIPFPPVHMEDTQAELWLAAHDRLVKASHALDRSLLLCEALNSDVNFASTVIREFRSAVTAVKEIEDRQRELAGIR